ncbi:hypothetical protein ILUMI_11588 [Ignelater luminosus]|uniref:HTH psq-type domain-containing protein n=1 Tax=Ignelater luminosus TaxID=2038154 RepID=A0A8K0GCK5_IGNLU|nr:hypothetical protein ILUMI_11588 [Ignelater luminosus]
MDLLYDGEMDLCFSVSENAEPRGLWTSNDLQSAINKVKSGIIGVNKTSKSFNIPKTTLKRKIKSNNTEKCNRLDPDSTLGGNAEEKRRPDIAVRKAKNVPVVRALGIFREIVQKYFKAPERILTKDSLFDKPGNIFNCDEANNRRRQPSKKLKMASSLSESEEVVLDNFEEEEERLSDYENESIGCGEDFRKTKKMYELRNYDYEEKK